MEKIVLQTDEAQNIGKNQKDSWPFLFIGVDPNGFGCLFECVNDVEDEK